MRSMTPPTSDQEMEQIVAEVIQDHEDEATIQRALRVPAGLWRRMRVQAASEGKSTSRWIVEVLPPVTGEEPLVRFLDGFQPSDAAKPIAPLILGDELRAHPNPGYDTARFLQAQWGDEVFANSAYVSAWAAEVEHLERKRAYLDSLKRPKGDG